MSGANPRQSNGNARRKVVAWLKSTGDHVCWLCGRPIDMGLRFPDPWSWTCDEVVPVARGGSPYDSGNVREAHLHCNSSRKDKAPPRPDGAARQSIRHSRRWGAIR